MPLLDATREVAYSKLDKEDPEEASHRRALFLIYKAMEEADSLTKPRPPCLFLRMGFRREKLRIGKRLRKLRKGVSRMVSGYVFRGRNKDVAKAVKVPWIRFFGRKDKIVRAVPPLLI